MLEERFTQLPQENYKETNITDQTVLQCLWAIIQKARFNNLNDQIQCILSEEKLIHLTIIVLEKQKNLKLKYDFPAEVATFVQKINKITMENFKDQSENSDLKFFSKAVDILMHPNLHKHMTDKEVLGKLKVLTFNNLACIYKKSKHFMMALKSVSFALILEEALIQDNKDEEKYDIIPTYLNKAAILSEMGKHDKAIQQIRKAKIFIEKIEKDVEKKLEITKDEALLKRLQQKRHYGLYMKMLINYNMGAEKQHMKLISSGVAHYQEGRKLAITINNAFMTKKFESIIQKLKS